MVVGHDQLAEQLRHRLPVVSLFVGPSSVGKATLARELLFGYQLIDTRFLAVAKLTITTAREIIGFVAGAGSRGILVDLDGATPEGVNALLKLLEDPPPRDRFIFTASHAPMETLASRAQVYRFGYLTNEEVARVVQLVRNVTAAQATEVAVRSGGQVAPALAALRGDGRGPVLSVLKAVATGDDELFFQAISGKRLVVVDGDEERRDAIDVSQLHLLRSWALEARTGRWRLFSPEESYGLDRDPQVVERILQATRRPSRPRVALRAALQPLIWDRRP